MKRTIFQKLAVFFIYWLTSFFIYWLAVAAAVTLFSVSVSRGQELPEFSNRWFLTAVYSDAYDSNDQKLAASLRTKEELGLLTTQTIVHEWNDSTPMLRDTAWKSYIGTKRPAILLQAVSNADGRGRVVYFESGESLNNNRDLPKDIQLAINKYVEDCPSCPLPRPRPRPEPAPEPDQTPTPEPETPAPIVPTVLVDKEDGEEDEGIPLIMLLIPVAAAAFGAFGQVKKSNV